MFKIISILIVAASVIAWLVQFFVPHQGLGIATGLAIYLVTWWIVLFAILPIGVRGQHEDGDVIVGNDPGAPVNPGLKRKVWWTTIAASAVWLTIFTIAEFGLIDIFG